MTQGWWDEGIGHDDLSAYFDQEEEYPRSDDTLELPVVHGDTAYKLSASAAMLGEGYPDVYPVEEAARSLTEVMEAAGYTADAGDDDAAALMRVPFVYGEDGSPPTVVRGRRVMSSGVEMRVVMDGAFHGIQFDTSGSVAGVPDLLASIEALPQEEWTPVGSFGEFAEETRRLKAMVELSANTPSRRPLTDPLRMARIESTLRITSRLLDLYDRMVTSVLDYQDTRYVEICVRKGSGLTADGSWLDVNFPGWRERLDRDLWPGTHYVSPGEGSTLCDLRAGKMAPDRRTDRFNETSCEFCKVRYLELFGPDEEDLG